MGDSLITCLPFCPDLNSLRRNFWKISKSGSHQNQILLLDLVEYSGIPCIVFLWNNNRSNCIKSAGAIKNSWIRIQKYSVFICSETKILACFDFDAAFSTYWSRAPQNFDIQICRLKCAPNDFKIVMGNSMSISIRLRRTMPCTWRSIKKWLLSTIIPAFHILKIHLHSKRSVHLGLMVASLGLASSSHVFLKYPESHALILWFYTQFRLQCQCDYFSVAPIHNFFYQNAHKLVLRKFCSPFSIWFYRYRCHAGCHFAHRFQCQSVALANMLLIMFERSRGSGLSDAGRQCYSKHYPGAITIFRVKVMALKARNMDSSISRSAVQYGYPGF